MVIESESYRCGFVALVGRPNVGKSSLMNQLIKQKVSIITAKPQTTRHRIQGILTTEEAQTIFIDTPGIHRINKQLGSYRQLNRVMNQTATHAVEEADLVIFLVDASHETEADVFAWQKISATKDMPPTILLLNKIDKVKNKASILPIMEKAYHQNQWQEIVPVSSTKGDNLDKLMTTVHSYLPLSPPIYEEEMITDRSEKFMIGEIIREKLTIYLHQELPYGSTIFIDQMAEVEGRVIINATIFVEKQGQKSIVIGKSGESIKRIGISARISISELLDKKVHLNLWVKVRQNWAEDRLFLETMA